MNSRNSSTPPGQRTRWWGKTALLGAALALFGLNANAQVNAYAFSQSSGTYTAITGTTVHASGWDDNVATYTFPSGSFVFNGTSYSAVSVNSNGYITFGATVSGTTLYTPISSTTGYAGAIAATARDMISNASTIVAGQDAGDIVIQWNNAQRYSLGAIAGDVLNYQIRLNQTTNVIRIVYGTCTATSATSLTVQCGLRGATNADFSNRTSATTWAGTTAGGTTAPGDTTGVITHVVCDSMRCGPRRAATSAWGVASTCSSRSVRVRSPPLAGFSITGDDSADAASPSPDRLQPGTTASATSSGNRPRTPNQAPDELQDCARTTRRRKACVCAWIFIFARLSPIRRKVNEPM